MTVSAALQKPKARRPVFTLGQPLSAREDEICQMVANGFSNQQIADNLENISGDMYDEPITASTVKVHLKRAFIKLGISDRIHVLDSFQTRVKFPKINTEALDAEQINVIEMIANGKSNATISAELGLSLAKIKQHLTNFKQMIGYDSRTLVAAWWRSTSDYQDKNQQD